MPKTKVVKEGTLALPKDSAQLQRMYDMPVFSTVELPSILPGLCSETVLGFVSARDDNGVKFDFSYFGTHLFTRTLIKQSRGFKWQKSK